MGRCPPPLRAPKGYRSCLKVVTVMCTGWGPGSDGSQTLNQLGAGRILAFLRMAEVWVP